jgi:hypothetical protein
VHEACPQSSGEGLDRLCLRTGHAHKVLVKDLAGYVCARDMLTKSGEGSWLATVHILHTLVVFNQQQVC